MPGIRVATITHATAVIGDAPVLLALPTTSSSPSGAPPVGTSSSLRWALGGWRTSTCCICSSLVTGRRQP